MILGDNMLLVPAASYTAAATDGVSSPRLARNQPRHWQRRPSTVARCSKAGTASISFCLALAHKKQHKLCKTCTIAQHSPWQPKSVVRVT